MQKIIEKDTGNIWKDKFKQTVNSEEKRDDRFNSHINSQHGKRAATQKRSETSHLQSLISKQEEARWKHISLLNTFIRLNLLQIASSVLLEIFIYIDNTVERLSRLNCQLRNYSNSKKNRLMLLYIMTEYTM